MDKTWKKWYTKNKYNVEVRKQMSECTHDCESCGQDCSERKTSFLEEPHRLSHIKKVIGVVSGKGGVGKSSGHLHAGGAHPAGTDLKPQFSTQTLPARPSPRPLG